MKRNVNRREFLVGLSAAAAGGFVAGCQVAAPVPTVAAPEGAPAAAQAAEELYGMVVFLKGSEFFNWSYKGMLDAATRIGAHVKTELQGPAEWDASLEARAIDELVAKGATGILATAGDATAMNASIDKAIDAGVPVVLFDSDAPASKRVVFARLCSRQGDGRVGLQEDRHLYLHWPRPPAEAGPGFPGCAGRVCARC
jgi:ABC-type sugar transport system substrate-binding protein